MGAVVMVLRGRFRQYWRSWLALSLLVAVVLIRFAAVGLCYSDDHLRTGDIPVRLMINDA